MFFIDTKIERFFGALNMAVQWHYSKECYLEIWKDYV